MKLANPSLLVIGLANGTFQGWNLSANSVDSLQAHQAAVHSLHMHDKWLISGALNEIAVRDTASFNVLLQGKANHAKGNAEVKALALMEVPGSANPIVVAGDSFGFLTLVTINAQNQP